jgi:hypothetical protein
MERKQKRDLVRKGSHISSGKNAGSVVGAYFDVGGRQEEFW